MNARDLQAPGPELYRHDLTIYLLHHPDELALFKQQQEQCSSDEEEVTLVQIWWLDIQADLIEE